MKSRAWVMYLVALVPVSAIYLFGPRFANTGIVFNLIGASAIVAIIVGSRVNRAYRRLPWYLFAAGQAFFVAGDVLAYNYKRFFGGELPFPSIADPFYLAVYPLLVAGLLIVIHQRTPRRDTASLIDSLIISTSIGVLSWIFLIEPNTHQETLKTLISVAYPVMDLLLLAVAVRLAVGFGRHEVAFSMLIGGIVALFLTDSIYGWILLHGVYNPGDVLDGGWIVFYALLGAAALHPSMRKLSEPAVEHEVRLTRARLALLAGATLVGPIAETLRFAAGRPVDVPVLAGSSMLLFLLVVARMVGLVRRNEESATREKALQEAGAALVTATSRDGIYEAAMDAVRSLVGARVEVGLFSLGEAPGEFGVVASTGRAWNVAQLRLSELPPEAQARLKARAVAEVATHRLASGSDLDAPTALSSACLAPLYVREDLRGILVVLGDVHLPQTTKEAFLTLAVEVALAIESAALTEELLRTKTEARYRSLFQHSSDLVTVVSSKARIMYASPSVEQMLGYRSEDLDGRGLTDLVHDDDVPQLSAFLRNMLDQPPEHSGMIEIRMRHRDESWLHMETLATNLVDNPDLGGIVLNSRDVSERKAFEEQLTHQAFHDTLTGLPNRALFRNRVEHALERSDGRIHHSVAILFLDIDDFKTVNDTLGHAAGDHMLREVAKRMISIIRGPDTAARLGGDEFAILLDGVEDPLRAADVAARVLETVGGPFSVDGKEVSIGATVGIAFRDAERQAAASAEELLRNADVAMYIAKEQGKGRYQVFEPTMHATAIKRLELKADLQRAVKASEFIVHYQPIMALPSDRMSGVEALVRWEHPERGLIPPLDFVPLAEESGLIVPIGQMVLEEACREAVTLQQHCPQDPPLTMSVNLSARQLQQPEIAAEVKQILEQTGLAPECLVLELTESVMMHDMDLALLRLDQLRKVGVRLAIDDFGTGYSSLNYIRQFPVDILKVDRSFIDGLDDRDGEISALTAAIIDLAKILKLQPVAEGIENATQLRRLKELGCDVGQGFFFHKPLTKERIEELAIAQARPARAAA